MGCFTPVPRVCRVRCLATGIPEEWLPDRGNTANRTRLTGRLVLLPGAAIRLHLIEDRMKEEEVRSASKGWSPARESIAGKRDAMCTHCPPHMKPHEKI